MVKIIFKILLLCFLLITMTGCPEPFPEDDTSIKIVNQSDEVIVWSNYTQKGIVSELADFWWGNRVDQYAIHPSDTAYDSFYSGDIQLVLEDGWIKYYLFNYDSVMTIPWERIRDERIILKEVTFHSWEEMEAADFTITYP